MNQSQTLLALMDRADRIELYAARAAAGQDIFTGHPRGPDPRRQAWSITCCHCGFSTPCVRNDPPPAWRTIVLGASLFQECPLCAAAWDDAHGSPVHAFGVRRPGASVAATTSRSRKSKTRSAATIVAATSPSPDPLEELHVTRNPKRRSGAARLPRPRQNLSTKPMVAPADRPAAAAALAKPAEPPPANPLRPRTLVRTATGYTMAGAVRSCRACGCTDADCRQCVAKSGRPCHWVGRDLCSACVPATAAGSERAA